MNITRQEIEEFLYQEAEFLDTWQMKAWADLFSTEGTYEIPPIGSPDADFKKSLFLVHDDRARLEQRALRLLKKEAHVEYPHSQTLHNVSNVRIVSNEEDSIAVRCNFTAYRAKRDFLDTYVGVNEYEFVKEDGELKIKSKKVILKLEALRPQGKISILL